MKRADRFKVCPICGVTFGCPYGLGAAQWAAKVCCSKKCAGAPRRKPLNERLINNVIPDDNGCWIWQGPRTGYGYGQTQVDGKVAVTHRLSWRAFHGEIPTGMHVLHKCDVRLCINPAHLFLGTSADNNADMDRKGRRMPPKGIQHSNAVFTEARVAVLRQGRYDQWGDLTNKARELGVDVKTLWNVLRGKTWKHVTPKQANMPPLLVRNRLAFERKHPA